MKRKLFMAMLVGGLSAQPTLAQSELYPKHFDLEEVTLLSGPMKTAQELNFRTLMQYDVDRLLTPYVRQSGLGATTDRSSRYYQWEQQHPSFQNWGSGNFNLDGHVGGHYLSALALAWAACHDADMKGRLGERLAYMVSVMKDCQDNYDDNTEGLYGFIGGQPINQSWKDLYKGNLATIRGNWGWVPFYCQHKILAGLRDAYLYGGSSEAKEVFRKLADWSVNVVSKVSDTDLESFLDCEHGGMNESLLDAYQLFGEAKYLTAAKRFTHKTMLNGMQTLSTAFLDNKHANTQVPKYIGMERIYEQDASLTTYRKAAENFWRDVAENRTVCIGGNSVSEYFLAKANSARYIDVLDGPESCNSNNMLKLSEMLADRTGEAKYADFYENAMWNHILSTQDPETGGYVYFTTLRPQAYRVYSQVNQGMWCCVGTGMENHSKYGHFIYTHDGTKTLYVNLFTASTLESADFGITQATSFPFEPRTTLTVSKGGQYAIAVRHPSWAGAGFQVTVNGEAVNAAVQQGVASYVTLDRTWTEGDQIEVSLPMELRYEECPNYPDYIAFKYGPILLAANVSAEGESLPHEYAGEGRMDHAPGSVATPKNLLSAPLMIGERADVLKRIQMKDASELTFAIDASREGVESYQWATLTLQPFYQIHHARYSCYWYQQTAEGFANSAMAQTEAANEALLQRTLDFVAPGEQQSEAGHEYNYSSDSGTGNYNGESYRDARAGGHVQYTLFNPDGVGDSLAVMCRFTTADKGRKAVLLVDGEKIADITIPSSVSKSENGFYNIEYPIPATLVKDAQGEVKKQFVVRLAASAGTLNPGLYYLRLVSGYNPAANAYQFRASDWVTGDAGRIAAANITYDAQRNVIKAQSRGANNIALMLQYENRDYTIDKGQTYLVVRGTGLGTAAGNSYLWWLNGKNVGSQVAPAVQTTISVDGEQQVMIAWNMATSGLYGNFTGDRPSVCMGQTIFGLTSKNADGSCEIYDINFVSSIEDYQSATRISAVPQEPTADQPTYTLQGLRVKQPTKGVYIQNGRKFVK